MIAPVVEVAGDDQGRIRRRRTADRIDQRVGLALATAGKQTKMYDITMHLDLTDLHHAVQDAARLVGMIRHVLIARGRDRKTAEQGVAVVSVIVHRVHPVGRMMRIAGQEFMLRLRRPMR